MKIIVDTSVWSLALRRRSLSEDIPVVRRFQDSIADGLVVLLGAVRQEILSGIRHKEQYIRLRDYLRSFPDVESTRDDYELAAQFYNTCRQHGIQGANTDFLICAVAHRRNWYIMTTDRDFENYKRYLAIELLIGN